jgi:hypothetical protein
MVAGAGFAECYAAPSADWIDLVLIRTYARSSPLKNLAIEDVPTAFWATLIDDGTTCIKVDGHPAPDAMA